MKLAARLCRPAMGLLIGVNVSCQLGWQLCRMAGLQQLLSGGGNQQGSMQ